MSQLHHLVAGDGTDACGFCNQPQGPHDCIDVLQRRLSELLTLYDARVAECESLRHLLQERHARV